MELGQKLKEARIQAGLKQEELAQTIGVSRQTVSSWENNRSCPDIGSAIKLSNLYGISLDEMLKEDKEVQTRLEQKAVKKKRFWQLALEYGLVLDIAGILLAGQDFIQAGYFLQILSSICVWVSLWMHIQLFDHTKEEIRRFVTGFGIVMVAMVIDLVFPDFSNQATLSAAVFHLLRAIGPLMVLYSNVWSQFWRSPRFFLILVFLIGAPVLNLMSNLQSAGSLNTDTPFSQEYRIQEVLYPQGEAPDPTIRIDLHEMLTTQSLRIYRNGDEFSTIGNFTYLEPTAAQKETGIWLLTPEDDPKSVYRLSVEADGNVILSYSQQDQLLWKWLLRKEYTCSLTVATYGHTMYMSPDWNLAEEPDPVPYFSHTDVVGKATVTLVIPDLETDTLTLTEQYHHAGQTEETEYILEPVKPGAFKLEVETRYDGKEEYALYRIRHKAGEFRFVLVYGQGAKDALYDLWAEK